MKIIKKAAAFLLAAVMVSGLTLQAGAAWNYDSNKPVSDKLDSYIEDFGEKWNNVLKCGTRMYYDGSTGEISVLSLARYGNTSHQECNIFYKYKQKTPGSYDFGKEEAYYMSSKMATNTDYYNEKGKIISEADFEKFVFEFCDNKNLIEIKPYENMSSFSIDDVDLYDPDYKFIRNITLDTKKNIHATLLPKIDIDSEDMDLKVSWKSSDSSIAEVDSSGNVTAKAVGSCDVTSEIEGVGAVEKYHITVEEYMTEDERAVRNAIKEGGSEKTIYDKIYNIDSYKAAGHVITDVDGDGKYELVTRDADRKTIKIYSMSDGKLCKPKELTAVSKVNMIYVKGSKYYDCYFETIKDISEKEKEVKIFSYNGPGIDMTKELTVNILQENAYLTITDSSGKVLTKSDSNYKYFEGIWQESFNDNCDYIISSSSYKKICRYIDNQNAYVYTFDGFIGIEFPDNYYSEGDAMEDFVSHGSSGRKTTKAMEIFKQLVCNELVGRYNYKFTDPLTVACMNKKASYEPDPDLTLNDITENKFGVVEKFNYDHIMDVIYLPQV